MFYYYIRLLPDNHEYLDQVRLPAPEKDPFEDVNIADCEKTKANYPEIKGLRHITKGL